jgi:hypothetical protein
MFPPHWFLPYDIVFQLITALVALAVAVYAFKGFKWVRESSLYYLGFGFVFLFAGYMANGLTLGYAYLAQVPFGGSETPFVAMDAGFWIYYLLSIVAFVLIIYAYVDKHPEVMAMAPPALGGSLAVAGPVMESVLVIMLFVILTAQIMRHMERRSVGSLNVIACFALVLLSHLLILVSGLDPLVYVSGKVLQLVSFLLLLALLYRLRGSG